MATGAGWHEDHDRMSKEALNFSRAIKSVQEELEAVDWYNQRARAADDGYPDSKVAPEAVYWRGVSHYKATNDHTVLGEVAEQFEQKYRDSVWALKALPWAH